MSEKQPSILGGSAASPTGLAGMKTDREAAVPPGEMGGAAASPTGVGVSSTEMWPKRKHPIHLANVQHHNQPVILFVTVCTENRRPVLACERVHGSLLRIWPEANQYRVGRYVVMPEHIHIFCAPAVHDAENVKQWVAYWKRLASRELKDLMPLWQRDCWDTQLRNVSHYGEKWEYVVRNPVRKGLVSSPEQWPYQGCLNELRH